MVFGIVAIIFYLVNLFIVNPVTVFLMMPCCIPKGSKKRKSPLGLKPSNASRTFSNTHISLENDNDIELANNTDRVEQVSQSQQSPQKKSGNQFFSMA